ncbi:hypothetical protein [Clostridium sp. cel8]|jgi:hypothetical protein|nr:hypothetical protein [Clostridium sp. cel8]
MSHRCGGYGYGGFCGGNEVMIIIILLLLCCGCGCGNNYKKDC